MRSKGEKLFREWLHDSVVHGLMATVEGNSIVLDSRIASAIEEIVAPVRGNRPRDFPFTRADARAIVVGTARWILKTCGESAA